MPIQEPVNVEEELLEKQQRKFEEEQQQERLQAIQAPQEEKQNSPLNQATDIAKQVAKNYVKTAVKSSKATSAPVLGWILGIIAFIGLFVGLIVMTVTSVKAVCDGSYSSVDMILAKVAVAWIPGDVCAQLATTDSGPTFSGGQSGGGGGGASSAGETGNRSLLNLYGIKVNKDCVDPTQVVPKPGQTCIGNMSQAALNKIISIAQACDGQGTDPRTNQCGVQVTGGNEPGHETGPCSHSSGNKFDLLPTAGLNSYITNPNLFTRKGTRSDGAPLYQQKSDGVIFADERNIPGVSAHWDIGGVGCT